MELKGENLIGLASKRGGGDAFTGFNPSEQVASNETFNAATMDELDLACTLAAAAARPLAQTSRADRATFLDTIAAGLLENEEVIVGQGMAETGLPEARMRGELGRTANQLRLFAGVLRDAAYLDIRVDEALPERTPPRPDIRLMMRPLGPVAVFGASNFPLAFSVAGGDTASALAAGCPVIAKAHQGHPGISEIVGRIIQQSVKTCGFPEGTFSLLFGSGAIIGQGMVSDPRIQAVGFTGSRSGGLALCETAAKRRVPIPVYAEMSSINPVLLLPDALAHDGAAIGAAFAQAQTLGSGQFCTSPGLLLALEGSDISAFVDGVQGAYSDIAPTTMLTQGIHSAYCEGVARLSAHPSVNILVEGQHADGLVSEPVLFGVSAADFLADDSLSEEVFGAASLLVRCDGVDQLEQVIRSLEGQLTAAIHAADGDDEAVLRLVPLLENIAGRVLFNGFGTGVEVSDAMVHGGPFPATSDSRTTSVGTMAIQRFLRPVSYQNVPSEFLPTELREENLLMVPHRRNGTLSMP